MSLFSVFRPSINDPEKTEKTSLSKKEIKKEIRNNGYNYSINNIIQSLDFLGKAQSCLREYEVGLKEKVGFKEYEKFDAK